MKNSYRLIHTHTFIITFQTLFCQLSVRCQAPLITGQYGDFKWGAQHMAFASGALYVSTMQRPYQINSEPKQNTANVLNLDSSRSNSIYTNVNNIRPLSRSCKFFIKY